MSQSLAVEEKHKYKPPFSPVSNSLTISQKFSPQSLNMKFFTTMSAILFVVFMAEAALASCGGCRGAQRCCSIGYVQYRPWRRWRTRSANTFFLNCYDTENSITAWKIQTNVRVVSSLLRMKSRVASDGSQRQVDVSKIQALLCTPQIITVLRFRYGGAPGLIAHGN